MAITRVAPTPRPARRRRLLLLVLGAPILILLLALLFAPTIAGVFAPGIIEGQANVRIVGTVEVGDVDLSWGGPQRVMGIRLLDPSGQEVGRLSVEAGAGLASLALGGRDLGLITISDAVFTVVRNADGTTNIQGATAPRTPAPPGAPGSAGNPGETRLPEGLKARVVVKDLAATYTDLAPAATPAAAPTAVAVRGFNAEAAIEAGAPLTLALSALAGPAADAAPGGRLTADVRVDGWSDATGLVTADRASVNATVAAKAVPVGLIDAFVGPLPGGAPGVPAPSLRAGLGETLDLALAVNGSAQDAVVELGAMLANASARGKIRYAAGAVSTESPILVAVKGIALRALVPGLAGSLAGSGAATVQALPDLQLTIDGVKARLPRGGASLDLRGAGANIVLRLTETLGTVRLAEGEAAQPFRIAPLEARVEAPDLSKGARVTAASDATVGGRPAGNLTVDMTIAGLLDAAGAPVKGPPASVAGTLALTGVATAIAQPFVQAFGLDLPADLGPTLDLEARASSDLRSAAATPAAPGAKAAPASTPQAAKLPPTTLDITARAEQLTLAGAFELSQTSIRTRGEGVRADLASAGRIAARLVKPETGWRLEPAGPGRLVLTLRELDVPRDAATGAPRLDQAGGRLGMSLDGLAARPIGPGSEGAAPVTVKTVRIDGSLSYGAARVALDSAMSHAGADFGATVAFDVPAMFLVADPATGRAAGMAPVERLRPIGKLELTNVPLALAALFKGPPEPPAPGAVSAAVLAGPPLDMARLLTDLLGRAATVVVQTSPGANDALAILGTVRAPLYEANLEADLAPSQLSVRTLNTAIALTPASVAGAMAQLAPALANRPRLTTNTRVDLFVQPLVLPLDPGLKPALSRAGVASIRLVAAPLGLSGLNAANPDGSRRDLGPVGVRDLTLTARAPIAALVGPGSAGDRTVTATLAGLVLGAGERPVATLRGDFSAPVTAGRPAGAIAAALSLVDVDLRAVERLANKDGLLTGALGETAALTLRADLAPPAGPPGAPFDAGTASGTIEAGVTAPRLKTDGPLRLTFDPARIALASPARFAVGVDPAWANAFLEPKPPADGRPTPKQSLRLTEATNLTVTLDRLSIPRALLATPAPGVPAASGGAIDAALSVTIPDARFVTAEGGPIRLAGTAFTVTTDPAAGPGGPVAFRLTIAEAAAGDAPPATNMAIAGSIRDLLDASGTPTPARATATMQGDLPVVPTALIDAFANQGGLLVDALGPTVALTFNVERYPLLPPAPATAGSPAPAPAAGPPPVVQATAVSSRAKASLRGTIQDNVYVSQEPLRVSVTELTQALSARFVKGLPTVGTIEKTAQDAPALLTATDLRLPLDNDLSKLSGSIDIDPGEARFGTSTGFAGFLKQINQDQQGVIGRRLQPLHINVVNGVATYDRWTVPLGQVEVQTMGTVDLVRREIDVLTYVPVSAVSDETVGIFKGGAANSINKVLGQAAPVLDGGAMLPFRTRGPMDNPRTAPDLELFAKDFLKNVDTKGLIEQGLDRLLKDRLRPPANPPK